MPRRNDIQKILVIGSGPIVIGQSAEFVDEMERLIPKPKLDEDGEKSLHWIPLLGPLSELKLPPSMLR